MLNKQFAAIATLAFATAAAPVLAADTSNIKVAIQPYSLAKKSPINLAHNFFEVPDTTVAVEACTYDRHIATVQGIVLADRNEADAKAMGGLPVQSLRRGLQKAFAEQLARYNSNELEQDSFMPGTFKDFSATFSDVTRAVKAQDKVTLVFMPRSATVGGFTENCPPVLKK
ncbi:MAG: hypothetical protein JWO78_2314 [Micavibrio sp.]|nr:hypothetical protein [Micavibrio sp.]